MDYLVSEPRITIVIINWNYARFVGDAIRSVKDQSYQNFRCLVVDNGSDDGSVERIAEAIGNHPQFELHRLPSNLGHLGAAFWALDLVADEFVTFLDADDVWASTYLASHLQVHLAAALPVAFTSSNCVDINAAGTLLTGGSYSMYHFWQQGTPVLRPMERTRRLDAVDAEAFAALAQAARYISTSQQHWSWCPGSSNMFRRTLLDRLRPRGSCTAVFGGVDGYFTPILHALTGTILIDQPLSAYRIHSGNDYSTLPSLTGLFSATSNGFEQSTATTLRSLIWLVDRIDEILAVVSRFRYWEIMDTVVNASPHRDLFSHAELKAALARRYVRLTELFGEFYVFRQLRRRMRFADYLEVLLAGRNGAFPLADFSRALSWEILRTVWRASRRLV